MWSVTIAAGLSFGAGCEAGVGEACGCEHGQEGSPGSVDLVWRAWRVSVDGGCGRQNSKMTSPVPQSLHNSLECRWDL